MAACVVVSFTSKTPTARTSLQPWALDDSNHRAIGMTSFRISRRRRRVSTVNYGVGRKKDRCPWAFTRGKDGMDRDQMENKRRCRRGVCLSCPHIQEMSGKGRGSLLGENKGVARRFGNLRNTEAPTARSRLRSHKRTMKRTGATRERVCQNHRADLSRPGYYMQESCELGSLGVMSHEL